MSQTTPSPLADIRAQAPLVHNITNYVVMNSTANALLALGASPVMAHAVEEVTEMARLSRALVLNIGTLSAPWIEAMATAARTAAGHGIPIVLDPVGCGATAYRTDAARALIDAAPPSVIRGNASEIRALARCAGAAKGVDSLHAPEEVREDALALARAHGCVVSVSGPVDLIVGENRTARVHNGHPIMTRVTGMGCTASAVTGAFLAVAADAFEAAVQAMVTMGVAGELAAARASGPGSFQMHFLDVLHQLQDADLKERGRQTGP
jgi:hydroxyethylthiazole kinase